MTTRDSQPPKHIFREYDVRGIVEEELTPELFQALGRAFGTEARARVSRPLLVVGHDNRPSSPSLADALASGLAAAGAEVRELGTVPTPTLYWAERHLEADGALQVTGSHNPADYNGLKMTLQRRSFFGDAVRGLRRRIVEGALDAGEGRRIAVDGINDRYVADLATRFDVDRPLHLVIDCGNGTGSLVARRILEAIGVEVTALFCESDGTFPNHHPDPTVDANLADLIAKVGEVGADAGVAFDGDADRIGVVDDRGAVIRGDVLLLLFGLDLLDRRGAGQPLVYDVKCSQLLPEVYEAHGGRPVMWKTGHSLIKEKMRETGALLAGELSGHIFFGDGYFGFDDAFFAACRLCEIMAAKGPLSERIEAFPAYVSTPEIRIEVGEERKWGLVEDAVAHFRRDYEVIDVDGARILFEGGWALLRASNTQPVVVSRYEARSEERLAEIRSVVEAWLREEGVSHDG